MIEQKLNSGNHCTCTCLNRYAFPAATHVLCLRHIRGNVKDYLTDKVGLSEKSRKDVLDKIFAPGGLVSADDSIVFEERARELRDSCCEEFLPYLDKRIIPALKENVLKPRLERGMGHSRSVFQSINR